jgi:hypothetical protein
MSSTTITCPCATDAKAGELTGSVVDSGNRYVDALLWGNKWDTDEPLSYWFGGAGSVSFSSVTYATHEWTTTEKAAMRAGLLMMTSVTLLTEGVEVTSAAEANLKWYKVSDTWFLGAHYGPNGLSTSGMGFFNKDGTGWNDLSTGGYGWVTIIHELGHALGLAHPHDGGGTSSLFPGVSGAYDYGDRRQNQNTYTVMSYIDVGADYNPSSATTYGFASGPMLYDVRALQYLYGAHPSYHATDTTYALPTTNGAGTYYTAIVDTGGTDTLQYAGSGDATLDARAGAVSRASGIFGGFVVTEAASAAIDRIVASTGNDVLTGNASDNVLTTGGGNDIVRGNGGNDTAVLPAEVATWTRDRFQAAWHAYDSAANTWTTLQGVATVHAGSTTHTLGVGIQWQTLMNATTRDVVNLKVANTGSGRTEVHRLAHASSYQSWNLQAVTPLEESGTGAWQFGLDAATGDIVCVKLYGTGSGTVEVHVLDASTNYTQWKLQTGTPWAEAGVHWQYVVAPNGNVVGVEKGGDAASGHTRVHVLTKASSYQTVVLQTNTPLHTTGALIEFVLAPNADLVAVKKAKTGTGSTEVHVLSAASNYTTWSMQTGTALHETDDGWHFAMDSVRNLWAVSKRDTGTNTTEFHILSAADTYHSFVMHTGTALHTSTL